MAPAVAHPAASQRSRLSPRLANWPEFPEPEKDSSSFIPPNQMLCGRGHGRTGERPSLSVQNMVEKVARKTREIKERRSQ